jgi:hypothetical protein
MEGSGQQSSFFSEHAKSNKQLQSISEQMNRLHNKQLIELQSLSDTIVAEIKTELEKCLCVGSHPYFNLCVMNGIALINNWIHLHLQCSKD